MTPFEHSALHHLAHAAAAVSQACYAIAAAVLAPSFPAHAAEFLKRLPQPEPATPPAKSNGE